MKKPLTLVFRTWTKSAAHFISLLFVSMAFVGTAQAVGELDPTFGNGGKVFTDFFNRQDIAYDMVLQPDGKIIVVGLGMAVDNVQSYNFGLVRYNTDGSLDLTFGTGGKVSTDFYLAYERAYAVALQSDGKILAVGFAWKTPLADGSSDFAIVRYNSNGTLDSTFGTGGKALVDVQGLEDVASAVVIQPDGKIVLAGTSRVNNGPSFGLDFAVARLNSNGSPDTSFDGDGIVTTNLLGATFFPEDNVTSVALYPDGKIVAGGATDIKGNFALVRYNPNGSLDMTFDTDGRVITDFLGTNNRDEIKSMVLQHGGKLLVVGSTTINHTETRGIALARYNLDGSLDQTFGGDGLVFTPPASTSEVATDVALLADGRFVVVNSGWGMTVSRYLSDGSLDPVFGNRGRVFSYVHTSPTSVSAVAVQPDGKILAAGDISLASSCTCNDFALVRFKLNPTSRATRSDFDGDGRSDIAVFRPSNGSWYVLNSSNGAVRVQPFGTNGDIAVPGDYDGDFGVTDFAVFRPSNGNWYILNSADGSVRVEHFGVDGDVPVAADYDGDGKTDIAVYRPSVGTWFMRRSSDNAIEAHVFGTGTDRPVPGYYDDDEKVDIAVFRESTGRWYITESSTNSLVTQHWGQSGDVAVPSDYGVDGIFEIAVYRPGTGEWFIGSNNYYRFGTAGDKPVLGDYNGDSVTDIALWRPSDGTWYFFFARVGFGTSGDTPVLNAYLP